MGRKLMIGSGLFGAGQVLRPASLERRDDRTTAHPQCAGDRG
jgi:hypothetical protein